MVRVAEGTLRQILDAVWNSAELGGFAGWDPYDGLNSRMFRISPLYRIPLARQAWIQLVKRSPFNIRPLIFQTPRVLPKTLALFALGCWRLAALGDRDFELWQRRGARLLQELLRLRSPKWEEICWGYPYDWQNRSFFQPQNEPNLICSVFGAIAFERRTDGGDVVTVPDEVSRFLVKLERQDGANRWITYTPTTSTQVHNVNMLGAALLARTASRTSNSHLAALARDAMHFSMNKLRSNGAWPYGEAPNQGWVDNFHTGYNLWALEEYREATGETWMDGAFENAWRYWDHHFSRPDGRPPYYDTKERPYDIHCCACAILTRVFLRRLDPAAIDKAHRDAIWALRNMWDGRQHFVFERDGLVVNRVPQIRWGQAWMFWALAQLFTATTAGGPLRPR